ncbi:condensin complex subunit 1 isoform X2 [Ananas comosus]|uniref:Condensin-1 complex subunit CAP-D2 n=1 Tax=Ananas comosus TaxID=4615 RepID=A0A6P5F1Y2_ANACO|nr:condensin complex subunit 1 isoform X1 [Ananas comosus]XP_020087515.1 condensin complex subunit 1 isoform X2 [Ananas comosus]
MAPPFLFPSDLRDLEEDEDDDSDEHRLRVRSPIEVSSLRPSEIEELVKGVAFDLSDKELFCVEEQDIFDRIYSLVRDFPRLAPSSKFNLVETLRSNLSVLLPNADSLLRAPDDSSPAGGVAIADLIVSHRNALKIYTFFLLNIVLAEESSSETGGSSKVATQGRKKNPGYAWNWEAQRSRIVNLIANSLEINLSLLFGSTGTDESYLSFISKCTFFLYENQNLLRDEETRNGLGRIIGTIATKHQRTDQTCASILHLIHKFDYAVLHIAEAVAAAEKKFGDGSLAVSLIREIGRADPKEYSRDGIGAENVGRFLIELAARSPKLMSTNIGVLVPHFGGESFKIRNALVSVLGKLVAKAFKDSEGDVSSKSLRLRSKQAMLEILVERCRDVSAYTRSRVLQVWAELCEENAVSIGLWNEVAAVASGRLEDKSAMVRKSALNLLITMLQHNPFGPQLRVAAFEATLEKYKEKLHGIEPSSPSEDAHEVEGTSTKEAVVDQEESVSDSCLPCSEEQKENGAAVPDIGNLEQIRALVASLEAGLRFSRCITSLMPTLVQLLASSSATDVENTILLLMRCRQFQIDGSEECLRKMLPLVFSQDKSIYEAVENAFITIYIRKGPIETAKNLLTLAIGSSIGDLAALERLISSLVSKGEISSSTISALWDYFCFNIAGVVAVQSRGALSILCMAAKASSSILSTHIQDIIDIGFGRWAKEETLLARTACAALERLSEEDKEKIRSSGARVFAVLQSLINGFWLPDNIWYAAADKAINAVYSLHPTPEKFAADIVKRSLSSVFSCTVRDEVPNGVDQGSTDFLSTVPAVKLSRFLFIVSHVALNQLVYIESCLRKVQKQKRKKEKSGSLAGNPHGGSTEVSEVPGINAELGLGASVDIVIDTLAERAEKEIVSCGPIDKNLIGYCAPFLSKLCRNLNLMQKYPELQASAMLALCRLMIIDSNFCEANLQLLFTVAENATSETVRSNCTIALGDLAARFPNLLEPWTEYMYARLRDPSVSVRKNAVLVLSHLILNDMMKVKGYINEMATRIEDEDERISSLAKLFFHELSKKGNNPIYNLLPDILGRLCNQNLKEESFFNIMQFLINSIKKDKQMEALVEKLCNRFTGVTDTRQWEYIAYCLSQLTFSEKGLKKLIESFKVYEHVLSEDSVMNHFRSIVAKCKKFPKQDLKACIEEFEEKLNKVHMERKEQEITARNARAHQQKVGSLQGLLTNKKGGKVNDKFAKDANGEVINPSVEGRDDMERESSSESNDTVSEESCHSSVVTKFEADGEEVQSPRTSPKGVSKSKMKKIRSSVMQDSVDRGLTRRTARSSRR